MFRSRHRLHRPHHLYGLHHWGGFGSSFGSYGRRGFGSWAPRRRRGPGAARILLAGVAALVFARLFSASNRSNRTAAEKAVLGIALAAVGALLLSLRRSAVRYRW